MKQRKQSRTPRAYRANKLHSRPAKPILDFRLSSSAAAQKEAQKPGFDKTGFLDRYLRQKPGFLVPNGLGERDRQNVKNFSTFEWRGFFVVQDSYSNSRLGEVRADSACYRLILLFKKRVFF